jgi:hypothetical protein
MQRASVNHWMTMYRILHIVYVEIPRNSCVMVYDEYHQLQTKLVRELNATFVSGIIAKSAVCCLIRFSVVAASRCQPSIEARIVRKLVHSNSLGLRDRPWQQHRLQGHRSVPTERVVRTEIEPHIASLPTGGSDRYHERPKQSGAFGRIGRIL